MSEQRPAPLPGRISLIGQYDSPFVRRVGVALHLYGIDHDHLPWSVFGDSAAVQALNPLMRVPVMVLEDGCVLTDSHMMLDHLDSRVDAPLFPRAEPARRDALRVAALACGLADKAVSLFYERHLHEATSARWEARCTGQIAAVLSALDQDRAAQPGPFWRGQAIGHEDIAVACAWRFACEAHPGLIDPGRYPALSAHSVRAEARVDFRACCQPFSV